jgi:hypothetical protein
MHLLDTRGSILAIGIQHAAWNASGNLESVQGDWQVIVAVLILTVVMAALRRMLHASSRPLGKDAEMAAAAGWTEPRAKSSGFQR